MYALISDLHSNLEALTAVFEDMAAFPVDEVRCLGDVIGYGPNPRECLDLVKAKAAWTLMGNHEDGLLNVATDFNDRARRALEWTGSNLNSSAYPKEQNYAYWEQLDAFEAMKRTDDAMFVHGSPRDPVREYVMPHHAGDPEMMTDLFAAIDRRVCFGGHTHVPGVFTPEGRFLHQSELPERVLLPPKSFVNIGSVGQPRDGDNRACYVLVDGDEILFRRVRYDFAATMRKIKAVPNLDDFLAARLKVGK